VFQQSTVLPPGTKDPSRIPAMRLRVANRFAVTSMLEVNSHVEGDPAIAPYAAEITPSADPANPSVYRVDLDPIDVPYLTSNPTEGIRYGFEALKNSPVTQGALFLTDVSLGTYSIYGTTNTVPVIASYAPSGGGAGALALSAEGASLSTLTFQVDANGNPINVNIPGNPTPIHTEGAFGITLDTRHIPFNTIGVIAREIGAGALTARPRIEENRQYRFRANLSSIQNTTNQAEVRLRVRTLKFAYTQYLVLGGAWAIGTDPMSGNAAIANQSLPGIGTQNPDRRPGQTNGGWYNVIIHSPLNTSIRPDSAGPIAARMPLISSEPGFGANSASVRDLRFGIDLIDSISTGPNRALEQGLVTLDEIRVQQWTPVAD
jgi:hypothetical protein